MERTARSGCIVSRSIETKEFQRFDACDLANTAVARSWGRLVRICMAKLALMKIDTLSVDLA